MIKLYYYTKNFIKLAFFTFLFLLANINLLHSNQIDVIFSKNLQIYDEAYNGFLYYTESNNIDVNAKKYYLDDIKIDKYLTSLRNSKPKAILCFGVNAVSSIKDKVSEDIPIIFCVLPYTKEFKKSNITGVSSTLDPEIIINKLKFIFPNKNKLGTVYSQGTENIFKNIQSACRNFGIQIIGEITTKKDFTKSLKNILPKADYFLIILDTELYFYHSFKHLIMQQAKTSTPVVGLSSFHTKAGALVSVEPNYYQMGIQAGDILKKIIDGVPLNAIDVKRPQKVKYSLNQIISDFIKHKFSNEVIQGADKVFRK